MPTQRLEIPLHDETATASLGARLAAALAPGMKIYLSGDLGAGKTTLVRGLLRAAGAEGRIKSPTYTLVETYNLSRLYFYHFDFYRLKAAGEWEDAGFREMFGSDGVCLVEWPERAASLLPPPDLQIELIHADGGRIALLAASSERGEDCIRLLRQRGQSPA